ncbi:MAG: hypothetical protein IJY25_03690 [Bacilli bacterium]|nr:hypothetical protein [Bacilli bacterium]
MKIISLSKKKFEELQELKLSREIFNTEAKIYDFNYRGDKKVLKTLYTLNGYTFANKLYTLEMLDSNRNYLPTSFYIPDYLCTVDGKVVGFTIPKIEGTNLTEILKSKNIDYKEQIYYLKKIGEMLNQLHNIRKYTSLKDFYINDLHDSNFIVDNNNRELKVIDLDSCKIGSNEPFAARFLTPFSIIKGIDKYKLNEDKHSNGYIVPNSDTDLYCYIMIIMNYLYGDKLSSSGIENFYEYLNYLEDVGVNKELLNIFSKVVTNCKNENPLNYLDSLTSEQIYRAKQSVYSKVKK